MDVPTNPRNPSQTHAPKAKPDARPMRIVLGAGGLAGLSALLTAIVLPPNAATVTTYQGQPVQYVQLAPGQTPPPGSTAISGTQAGTLVTRVAGPAQTPIVIRTTQSGKVIK
jgi:nitrous oxidase accessory protein NosD